MKGKITIEKQNTFFIKSLVLISKNNSCDSFQSTDSLTQFKHIEATIFFRFRGEKYYTSYKAA